MQPADGDLHPHLLRARRKWKVMTCPVPLGTAFLTGNFLSRRGIHTNKQAAASSPTSPCEGGGGKAGAHMQTQAQLTTRICLPKFASDAAHPHASTCALNPVLSFLLLASPISFTTPYRTASPSSMGAWLGRNRRPRSVLTFPEKSTTEWMAGVGSGSSLLRNPHARAAITLARARSCFGISRAACKGHRTLGRRKIGLSKGIRIIEGKYFYLI